MQLKPIRKGINVAKFFSVAPHVEKWLFLAGGQLSRSFLFGISTEREGRPEENSIPKNARQVQLVCGEGSRGGQSPSRMSVIWRENPEPTGAVSLEPGEQ